MEKVIANLLAGSQLTDYPDKKLYNAASMLKPEERVGPARLADPNHILFKLRPNTEGTTDYKNKSIVINPNSPIYKNSDDRLLAALLAHEGVHLNQGEKFTGQTVDEFPAYKKQQEVLRRLKYKDHDYMSDLADRIAVTARKRQ